MQREKENTGFIDVYSTLIDLVGYENMQKIYREFSGQQITFPKRFYKSEFVREKVNELYDGENLKQLAKKYGYTERYLRKLLITSHKQ